MTAIKEMTPGQLADGCRQTKPDNTHEPYCFELFRRAIVEKSERCWSALYGQYSPLVAHWISEFITRRAPLLEAPVEELVTAALTAFWRAFTTEKLTKAQRLADVLSYLKSCCVTTVLLAKRREEGEVKTDPWKADLVDSAVVDHEISRRPDQMLMAKIWQEKLWQIVNRCCHNERERLLARLSFVSDLKPSEILERHPDQFANVAEIYTMRRNLKNRLERDQELQEMWGES